MNSESLLNNLIKQGKLKKQNTSLEYLDGLLMASNENFTAAKKILDQELHVVAFKTVYDGILQIARVVLLINGYRPDDGEQHKTTFLVASILLEEDFKDLIKRIDLYRIKRNNCVYQPLIPISKRESQDIIELAEEFWRKVKTYLKAKDPRLKLFDF